MKLILDESYFEDCNTEEIKQELPEGFNEINLNKTGTCEYEANTGRQKHIEMYRKFAHLLPEEEITEDNINEWALNKTATYANRGIDKIRAEILGQKWSEYEL